ncbi:hypothetical protein ABEB36_005373 [Hypothenemus hampei]|uniref:Odorant receptor n=1 Tax=Hypothenemus hampei TaxID=57062 RepID=A0ABD1F0M3_HYPHA
MNPTKESKEFRIMRLHTHLLKFLLIWPSDSFSEKLNWFVIHGCLTISIFFSLPVFSAVAYQFYVGIDDLNTLLEALIGVLNIIISDVTYLSFLRKQKEIQKVIDDIYWFVKYCGFELIKKTDEEIVRLTKCILYYVILGVTLNLMWPLLSIKSCVASRKSEFYIRHDPCGMPTQNMYPLDASKGKTFLLFFTIEAIYCYHTCLFFSLATVIFIGFLKHISAQLKYCAYKFEHVFDDVSNNVNSIEKVQQEFIHLIKYHQSIFQYTTNMFGIFDIMIVVYIGITSFTLAIIGYQIVSPTTNDEDRIRYTILLIGLVLLFYSISYYGQQVHDEFINIGDAIFKSQWYENGIALRLHLFLLIVSTRTKRGFDFKVKLLGSLSLIVFMRVMKRAYQMFALLLTVANDTH